MKFDNFSEYLNAKGKTVESPVVTPMADKLEVEPKAGSSAQAKTKKAGKKHNQVKEFVDAKGKLVEKPATEIIADYKGPVANAPAKSQGGSAPKPYQNGKNEVPKVKDKDSKKPLGDEGSNDMVYNPNTSTSGGSKNFPGGKEVKSFLDETKNMTTVEFTRHMKGQIGFDAIKSVKDLVRLSESNKNLFFNLAYEVKRNGKLEALLEALLGMPATYKAIAKLVKEDTTEGRVKYLYTAINEAVGPPIGMDDIDDGHGEEGHPDDENSDEEAPEGEEEGEEEDMDMEHPDDAEGEEGGEEGDEEMDMGDEDGMDMGDEDMDQGEEDQDQMGDDANKPFPSFKQKFNLS